MRTASFLRWMLRLRKEDSGYVFEAVEAAGQRKSLSRASAAAVQAAVDGAWTNKTALEKLLGIFITAMSVGRWVVIAAQFKRRPWPKGVRVVVPKRCHLGNQGRSAAEALPRLLLDGGEQCRLSHTR